jgi:hypothetical protein
MVPGKLFLMDGFRKGDPCPGQSKGNRQMANKLSDPISLFQFCKQLWGQVIYLAPAGTKGFINPLVDIRVEIEDKPGVLADVTSILAGEAINIKIMGSGNLSGSGRHQGIY